MRGRKPNLKKRELGQVDVWLFAIVVTLLSIGVVMVYSASSYHSMFTDNDSAALFKKQALFAVIGIIAMVMLMRVDYHKYNNKKIMYGLYIVTIILLLAVFLFPSSKGAQRWIKLPGISFQPSELGKYTVVLFLAYMLNRMGKKIKDFKQGVLPCLIFAGVIAAIILAQRNLSIASITMMVAFGMIFISGARVKHMFGYIVPPLFGLASLAILLAPYRMARLLNFMDPWKDPAGNGYQLIQSLYALGSGGITGLGLGESRQKTMYMPEPHNDFIFSIVGEELGYIGCLVIMLLFVALVWRGIKIAMEARDSYGALIAIGITAILGIQCLINIAVVTGSMPVTGVPLPFISYGGSSLVINLAAVGILLNISRQKKRVG
ncbi:stage V sporulation protein E [uncultured Clostridium sp.]|uniref:stage V sporulation protein E n=1 Tax=uncultured Clostridium sp. TaxID=59620 RepID=UPI00261B90FF|nr:stage V sporulation protein E [uncultured Clostridium sp.]